MNLDQTYWNQRYLENNTPWDAGEPTTPIKNYVDSLDDHDIKILIPGAGNGHEARYLFEKGFTNVWVCDWAEEALSRFSESLPEFPKSQLLNIDFFKISQQFDLIIEQTFLSALPPGLRESYVEKTAALLQVGGRLVGLLFANPFSFEGPPFGGTNEEYLQLFSPKFEIEKLEMCYNSIPPRKDQELFINFLKTI
jgi:thiopurine S-methyltransferase